MQYLVQDGKSWEYKHVGPAVPQEQRAEYEKDKELFRQIEIKFKYDRAGTSMWTYQSYPGGIYISFHSVILELKDGRPYSTRFTIDFSKDRNKGFSIFLIPLERGNPTKLKQVAEFFDQLMPEMGNMWFEQGADAVRDRLKDACVSFQNNHKLGSFMVWPAKEQAAA